MNKKQTSEIFKNYLQLFASYFLRGCILVLPTVITLYFIFSLIAGIDNIITANFESFPKGTGLVIIVFGLTFIGMVGGSIILAPFKQLFKHFIERTPGVKLVYKAIKDFLEALVGDKKKFSHPVLVKMSHDPEIWQFGFVTQDHLSHIHLPEYVTVYCPKSYGFLGDLVVVKATNVKPVEGMNSSEVMKFVLSGGVANDAETESE